MAQVRLCHSWGCITVTPHRHCRGCGVLVPLQGLRHCETCRRESRGEVRYLPNLWLYVELVEEIFVKTAG